MFTGIIQTTGTITEISPQSSGARLVIAAPHLDRTPNPGDSIAVAGCCLTHAPGSDAIDHHLYFDVVHETLRKTKLGTLNPGDLVNLESAVTPTSTFDGHFVQGHIDALAEVTRVDQTEGRYEVHFRTDSQTLPYLTPKGSVTLDGVSLTIASVNVEESTFSVALIPTTLEVTTLERWQPGDTVNVETDILARTVLHYLRNFTNLPA